MMSAGVDEGGTEDAHAGCSGCRVQEEDERIVAPLLDKA